MISLGKYCDKKRIHIYGAGNWGRLLAIYLKENDIEVDSFIVSTLELDSVREILGIPVKTIEEYENEANSDSALVVAVSAKFRDKIIKVLSEKGIKEYYVLSDEEANGLFGEVQYKKDYHFINNINVVLSHSLCQ